MIKYLYSEVDTRELSLKLKRDVFICVILLIVAVTVGIFTCTFVTDDNAMLLKIINIVLSSVCLCITVYFILNRIVPISAKRTYIEKLLHTDPSTVCGKVTDGGKKITAMKRMEFIETCVLNEDGKELILYWDSAIAKPDFVGHTVNFYVVNNKIVGYGDEDEAGD